MKLQRANDGKLRRHTDGKVLGHDPDSPDPCCCGGAYIQAKRCRDFESVDLWVLKADITIPYYFKKDEVCYYILESNNESDTPGTLMGSEDEQEDCTPCTYIQARKCIGGDLVDLWRLANDGVPYYFLKSGVCYKIEDGNPTSETAGTLVTGETEYDSCEECLPCSVCAGSSPDSFTVTFSDITLCTCLNMGSFSVKLTGSFSGTFCLQRISQCVYRYVNTTWSGVTADKHFSSLDCTGDFTRFVGIDIVLTLTGSLGISFGGYRQSDGVGPFGEFVAFSKSGTAPNCTSFTWTSDLDSSDCPVFAAYGGSADVSAGC